MAAKPKDKCLHCELPVYAKRLCRRHYKKMNAIKNGTYKKRWQKIKQNKDLLEEKNLRDQLYRERKKMGIVIQKKDDNALMNQDWKKYIKEWKERTPYSKKRKMKASTNYYKYRLEAIRIYSNNKNCCKVCGISDIRVLDIDHINNDGAEHRKKIGQLNLVWWMKSNNYPPGFQILCRNCNWIKEFERKEKLNEEKWL